LTISYRVFIVKHVPINAKKKADVEAKKKMMGIVGK